MFALINAATDARLPDKQLQRERLAEFWMYFQPKKRNSRGYWRRRWRDRKRRLEVGEAVLEDGVVVLNRAQKRATGGRGYSHGLGRMDIPKGKKR